MCDTTPRRNIVCSHWLYTVLLLFPVYLSAAVNSDTLVIMSADGTRYTAQHTLASDGALITIHLPTNREPLHSQFFGPEKLSAATAHQESPQQITLQSGSAITRYQHRFSQSQLVRQNDGSMELTISSLFLPLTLDSSHQLISSVTWLFPDNATILSFNHDTAASEAQPQWQTPGSNTLTYTQRDASEHTLHIRFKLLPLTTLVEEACVNGNVDQEQCSADIDADNVPDSRDVCVSDKPQELASREAQKLDILGCDNQPLVILEGVEFQNGQSYLDAASRRKLDVAARALQRMPDTLFEVRSHTDNRGRAAHNQRLSENRADAVRHYLMLRGVGPNQLRSRGFGEMSPTHDNQLESGRRANRRIELKRLN